MEKTHPSPHFHPLMRPSQGHGDSSESWNPKGMGGANDPPTVTPTNAPNFHTLVCRRPPAWAIGTKACPGLRSGIISGAGRRHQPPSPEQRQPRVAREKCSAGACPQPGVGWGAQTTSDPAINQCTPFSHLGVPAPAGMDDWYENAPTRLSSAPLNPSIPRSRHSGPSIRHSREGGNPEGWGEGVVTLGLVPSLGRAARSRTLHRPAYHHFHPLMRPSQDHGDSGERWNPEGEGKGKTMAILAIDAVWALRLRQLAELARPYTKTTQRRGQT